ncbi:MAG TPA: 4Fe-4S dicluster domain-containing protein [Flexivirga sp.]|uniref:4Fe-4S dicluster domain-containing protein n=1 Tax=Flexivirga sp. TaxID=1962927 RepID=UPI002B88A39B|nr:4Fe-4S dicluster domain-containing protein [Flexivirga sp.]HWC22123.1 4Fe-4S dicluster domain-containing protein [Flexivirga sp.]
MSSQRTQSVSGYARGSHHQLAGPTDPAADAHWPSGHVRKGFFTDTSICIGCKACEVACKEWNRNPRDGDLELTGWSYDNTQQLGASTWRHVAFIEQDRSRIEAARESGRQLVDLGMPTVRDDRGSSSDQSGSSSDEGAYRDQHTAPPDTPEFRWLMASDVCKHCTHAGCLDVCPTGALFRTEFGSVVVQDDVCNGCGTCVAGCPFGVIERRSDGTAAPTTRGGEKKGEQPDVPKRSVAQKCTLCYDRLVDDETPACAKTCPTTSIKFGDHADLLDTARDRVRQLHDQGLTEARLYGANDLDGVGGTGAMFLLLDEPETYGLPPDPRVPTADLPVMFRRAGMAAAGMLAAAAIAFVGGAR